MAQPQIETTPQLAALPDAAVVARVLAGETDLFEILMRRYNQRLFRVARGFVRDAAEAEDVTQEAFVSAFHKLGSFRGEASFATWLTRIAVHEAMARNRRGRRLVALDAGSSEPVEERHDPERSAADGELRDLLEAVVGALPDPLRSVFILREVEGLSARETAEVLDISPENARVRLHRAKALLKRQIDEGLGRETRRLYLFDGKRCDRVVESVFARIGGA